MSWFEWKVAWRFLSASKSQSLLILLGISVGVSVQIFLGFLINGLQADLVNQTVGTSPHITISAQERVPRPLFADIDGSSQIADFSGREAGLRDWESTVDWLRGQPEFTAISPTLIESGFVRRGEKNLPTAVRGVDIDDADNIYDISGRMTAGEPTTAGSGILLGAGLADELNVLPGDSLQLTGAGGSQDRFLVEGIFDLGSSAINDSWIIMSLQRAQAFMQAPDQVSSIELQIGDVFAANAVADRLAGELPEVRADSWKRDNAQLLSALQSQSSSSLIIQFLVIVAVTLGISSVLAVSVVQKSKQIGILKAMGTRSRSAAAIFVIQGAVLGAFGSVFGVTFGTLLSRTFTQLVRDGAGDPLFPIEFDVPFVVLSAAVAILAGTLAGLIPAQQSKKLSPIEVIRGG